MQWSRLCVWYEVCFFFQAEDGIRDLVRSRGLGDVYKRQRKYCKRLNDVGAHHQRRYVCAVQRLIGQVGIGYVCLLYTSDAADERSSVDLGGRRIIKKKRIVDTLSVRYITVKYEDTKHNAR